MDFREFYSDLSGKMAQWGGDLADQIPNLAVAIAVLFVAWLISRILRRVTRDIVLRLSKDPQISGLVSSAVYLVGILVGLFIALGILGLEKAVTSLLAGAGIIGIAIGFAFQDIGSNFIAGVYMSLRHPFRLGDYIATHGHEGTVESIKLRATRIRTTEGQIVVIPNKDVFNSRIINYTTTGKRRIDLPVGVSYTADLDHVRAVAIAAIEEIPARDPQIPVEVFFSEFGESSINLVARFWTDFKTPRDFHHARSEALERIKKAFERNGIVIPYPIRTLEFPARSRPEL